MIAKEVGFSEIFGFKSLKEMPIDFLNAVSYSLNYLNIVSNVPREYQPKGWQWYFDDEVSNCVERFIQSTKPRKENEMGGIENEYAKEVLKMISEGDA